jgi:DNA repair protein RecN (Recombination protein N)
VLLELHVKNLAVLASATVELGDGLNVLTGETGAGKSIVVDSLVLLSGARASSDLIRTGADTLTVTGVFRPEGEGWRRRLDETGIDAEGDTLLVRREVSRSGRNRVLIEDQPATVRLLTDLAPWLLRIHGQREELGLVDPELQRVWLDESGGEEARELLTRTARDWEEWRAFQRRLGRLSDRRREVEERIDLLEFQASEIDAAGLTAGEEEELRSERDVLRNREQIVRALGGSFELLHEDEGSAVERVGKSLDLLEEVETWEPQAREWLEELEELRIRLGEVASGLRDRVDGLEADPGRLNEVEERLAVVERLVKKYGGSSHAVLERRREIGKELEELAGDLEDRSELEAKTVAAREVYRETALALSEARVRWGERLVERIESELGELGLGKARLTVALERLSRSGSPLEVPGFDGGVEAGPAGVDQVVFLFAPNPGEEPRPLAKIASGGELSRIYLALQLAVQGLEERPEEELPSPTLVFDEVDVGISGAQAAALGRKLQRLAAGAQILAVTHLPQVASCADHHFQVTKEVRSGRTHTEVAGLDDEARVREVARLLAGEKVTEQAAAHARELIASAVRESR